MELSASKYVNKPVLVFWETTKACDLTCLHCRATSMKSPAEGELDQEQSIEFLDQLTMFDGKPPVLIMTGGDVMKKKGLDRVLERAGELKIPFALSPAVTGLQNDGAIELIRTSGASSISISLDGRREFHDLIRGAGIYDSTLRTLDTMKKIGVNLQVNTLVSGDNLADLPYVLKILLDRGIRTWEIFFLIKVGRGVGINDVTPEQYDAVNRYLVFVSGYGINVRTVEGPYFRKLADDHNNARLGVGNDIFESLRQSTIELCGVPDHADDMIPIARTSDGNGVIFVSHDGNVKPSGFLPMDLGNVLNQPLVDIYRHNPVLQRLRDRNNLASPCLECPYREICGGSRARAFYYSGDVLGRDPVCPLSIKREN